MAGNSFRWLWSWISIMVLSGCLLTSSGEQVPCVSYLSNTAEDTYNETQTEVMLFLREYCDDEINATNIATNIQDYFNRFSFDVRITIIPLSRKYISSVRI